MKKCNYQILTVVVFSFLFISVGSAQQYKKERSETDDTIVLKEVVIPSGFPIDTTEQKILFVLEKQPIKQQSSEYLDFIVLYDNHSALSFEMGSTINIHQIYWASQKDSIIFFSASIYNKVKHLKNTDQIAQYILDNGEREHIGNRAFGFDCLIQDTIGYYWTYNNLSAKNGYLFKKEEKLSKHNLEYYYHVIGKK